MLGWAPRRAVRPRVSSIPAASASSKERGSRASSGRIPSRPATSARSVPWPVPVAAKEPWSSSSARRGVLPSSLRVRNPILAAPAVWDDDGPTIIGPMISKIFIVAQGSFPTSMLLLGRRRARTRRRRGRNSFPPSIQIISGNPWGPYAPRDRSHHNGPHDIKDIHSYSRFLSYFYAVVGLLLGRRRAGRILSKMFILCGFPCSVKGKRRVRDAAPYSSPVRPAR